jgi:methylated-DNA-[protein]-cysteine S-methyltransferase
MGERMTYYHDLPSPIGPLRLVADEIGLRHVVFPNGGRYAVNIAADWIRDAAPLREVSAQLQAYFAGELIDFDLPLAPQGTAFQQQVWQALREIPYGATTNYGEIARRLGDKNLMRAVGMANGRNPLPIIIPCHRVIGANGSLVGFGGGLPTKRFLLDLESRHSAFALMP